MLFDFGLSPEDFDDVNMVDEKKTGFQLICRNNILHASQQFPMPPANMPIPDPAVLAGMPPPPTGINIPPASFMVPTSAGGEQQQSS